MKPANQATSTHIALLTGGGDRPYVFGLAAALVRSGVSLDLIGSDDLEFFEFTGKPGLNFLNLRGDNRSRANPARKVARVLLYYARLMFYAATARPKIFHILWNNKFEVFDRTLLMLYYRLLGKKIVLTLHNVNTARRDSGDTALNRLTLRIQYHLSDHIFVHTKEMKRELREEFGVKDACATVIPFGINNAVPKTDLTAARAKQRLGLSSNDRAILFFGNIAPYKGLEHLVAAFRRLTAQRDDYRLVIAGRPKSSGAYWAAIRDDIREDVQQGRVLLRAEFIPDEETEIYFKGADVLVLPYTRIYQSGVLFLAYSFGLPVIAADVGCLKDEIVEGETGFVFNPGNPEDLARAIECYFASKLFQELSSRRGKIQKYAAERHSWDAVSSATLAVYTGLLSHRRNADSLAPGAAMQSTAAPGCSPMTPAKSTDQ